MADTLSQELLGLNQKLLDCIAQADWKQYQELCDSTLTCFEPEAAGNLVEGLPFHQFYFQLRSTPGPHNTTMVAPHVRVMGDVAVVSYVRLVQRVLADGAPVTRATEETRIWQKQNGAWKHVHFHRSVPSK